MLNLSTTIILFYCVDVRFMIIKNLMKLRELLKKEPIICMLGIHHYFRMVHYPALNLGGENLIIENAMHIYG